MSINTLFQNYGITGVPAIDALILAHIIPLVATYITTIFSLLKEIVSSVVKDSIVGLCNYMKSKVFGIIDMRICISQDNNIYPFVRDMIFSKLAETDYINPKTLGILSIITESKNKVSNGRQQCDTYDLFMNSSNDITIEKNMMVGSNTAFNKKYYQYGDYYIVVSENKKTDFTHFYQQMENAQSKSKKPDEKQNASSDYFILFEAIRMSNRIPRNDNIIMDFLLERFNLKERIPYKYVMKLNNQALQGFFGNIDTKYLNGNTYVAELDISDGFDKFISNPKVRTYYQHNCTKINKKSKIKLEISDSSDIDTELYDETIKYDGLPTFLSLNYNKQCVNVETFESDLIISDTGDISIAGRIFEPNFKSILSYFFGTQFADGEIGKKFFYFKDNKIIMYFIHHDKKTDHGITYSHYLCVISFQEVFNQSNLTEIFRELSKKNVMLSPGIEEDNKIYTFGSGTWKLNYCEHRPLDTIYLPSHIREFIISEMDKFICYEKIYKKSGIPYKKGFLFYGPPGTGKTSLVKAIASTYSMPIYVLDINNESITDDTIAQILNFISGVGKRIVLFEDIDSAFADKEELKYQVRSAITSGISATESKTSGSDLSKPTGNKYLTYAGLLNALDGVLTSQHGTIVIMTTNYKHKLGDALIRPGRIDHSIELGYCDRQQIIDMTSNLIIKSYDIISEIKSTKSHNESKFIFINPYHSDELMSMIESFADNLLQGEEISRVKPCELQVYVLRYLDNVEYIFKNYHQLL